MEENDRKMGVWDAKKSDEREDKIRNRRRKQERKLEKNRRRIIGMIKDLGNREKC